MANGRGKSEGSRKALEEHRGCFNAETALIANKKSQEKKAEYKTLKEIAKEMFSPERKAQWLAAMAEKADGGDTKAFEVLRDTMGEKPSDSVEISGANEFRFELKVIE